MANRLLFTSRRRGFGGGRAAATSELRNPERELFYFRRRLSLVALLVFVAFCGLFARFFYLQVVQHAHFETLAESNRIAIVPVVPNRGVITDRNGVVLAQSYSAYTLEITPSRVADLDETIDRIAEIVDVQPRDRKRFRKLLEESRNFESLPLRTKLTDEEVARVQQGSSAPGWSAHEAAILRGVEELIGDQAMSDETWNTLAKSWEEPQLIEFPMMVGQYVATAFVQNSLRIRLAGDNPGLFHR